MKLQLLQFVVVEPAEQNSCVVFDMPSDSSTILPPALGAPDASSGTTACARDRPAAACAAGSVLLPPGYSPPTYPLYVPVPSSGRGTRPAVSGPMPEPLSPQDATAS